MKRIVLVTLLALGPIAPALADCFKDGTRTQRVMLSSGDKIIDRWNVGSGGIHRVKLANGFELGLAVEPATQDKYREILESTGRPAVDELVKISVYDMSGERPELLTYTWGGSNSLQGYGPRGGADTLTQAGEQGIELWLQKPVCMTADAVASTR